MALRTAALALLAGAAHAQDDTRDPCMDVDCALHSAAHPECCGTPPTPGVEVQDEAGHCTPFEGGARPCADGLICHDHWDNANAVWEGSFTCYPEGTMFTQGDNPDTPRCADVGGDPMMACAPTFWCNADGACESVLRDGDTPSPCDMCHGTCSDADDADACHRGCENTACAPTMASLEEDCPSEMAMCTGDPSGECQTALGDMLAAYATGGRASPGTSDLFTDVALCMFTKGDPNCATETRDCFLDGDCLPLMHAMETTPPEPGNGLLEGETCFSRFDRLPLR